jgi:CubicO group peptidase (beta-lactamase class C family)
MPTWHVPGGQLAVAWDGRLVLNRGYGLADVDRQEPVQPEALFRIASASKAITAVAILTLVDAGTLALDDRAFPLLGLSPAANAATDPRLDTITVEQLLVSMPAGGIRPRASIRSTCRGAGWRRRRWAWRTRPSQPRSSATCWACRSISTPAPGRT